MWLLVALTRFFWKIYVVNSCPVRKAFSLCFFSVSILSVIPFLQHFKVDPEWRCKMAENVQNMQMSPGVGFVWLFNYCLCNRSTFLKIKFALLKRNHVGSLFTNEEQKKVGSWRHNCILLLHRQTLFMTSHRQEARHKIAAFTAVFSRLSNVEFEQTRP